jgi:hypothetical protein
MSDEAMANALADQSFADNDVDTSVEEDGGAEGRRGSLPSPSRITTY